MTAPFGEHRASQRGIHVGLIRAALGFEPRQDIEVDPNGDGSFNGAGQCAVE